MVVAHVSINHTVDLVWWFSMCQSTMLSISYGGFSCVNQPHCRSSMVVPRVNQPHYRSSMVVYHVSINHTVDLVWWFPMGQSTKRSIYYGGFPCGNQPHSRASMVVSHVSINHTVDLVGWFPMCQSTTLSI